uniref:RTA-like protein n=1 Tax=Mycena chlorophos TaxID=658473 RepID=A0ABQ0MAG1_MYCCL|nr:RTA-like protein [Mycena chlorophos]
MSTSLRLLVLVGLCTFAAARETAADGENIIGGYIPRKSLSILALSLYGISAIAMWIQFFIVKPRRKFILWLTFGMTAMATGFVLRIIFANDPTNEGKYIGMDLFILLSPCLFLATNYMILSHLVRIFPQEVVERSLLVRQSRIVKIFVWSDVTTFLLQSSGGGLTAMKNVNLANIGNKVHTVVNWQSPTCSSPSQKHAPKLWDVQSREPFRVFSTQPVEDWRILFYTTCVTCIGILIRSVFRIVEFVGGYNGRVFTHESYFYICDALPLWIAMSLYCFFLWPIRAFNRPPFTETGSVLELKQSA